MSMSSKEGSAVAMAGRGRVSISEAVGEVERWASVCERGLAEVLAFENETVLRLMEKMVRGHPDVPDAWRAVAGGSYCKLDQQMPAELRRRLSRAVSSTESSS
jgi:head-tail adaptor